MLFNKSLVLHKEAIKYIPGGVNSPVRSFSSVECNPIFIKEASGSKIIDVDDNQYIDYICSWGPLILGHSSKIANEGVIDAFSKGITYGITTKSEIELAKMIINLVKPIEKIRMVNSGTEATMSALRLARGYTGKNKILKFEGCYHGHCDSLLIKSGSGTLASGVPTSKGIPVSIAKDTLVCEFNNIENVKKMINKNKNNIAAIIVEPIPGNMGLIEPKKGFLQELRKLATVHKIVLIFDEVISGFRIAPGGASEYYKIDPDIVCLGKIIGGGMPVGAYGGKREIMDEISPVGGVYQAGTLSGNPIAMKMGLNVLTYLHKHKKIYKLLENKAIALEKGFKNNLKKLNINEVTINRIGSMLCQFFTKGPVNNYDKVMTSNTRFYSTYFKHMLEEGILLAPAQFECMFLSTAHSDQDINKTIKAHYRSMKKIKDLY